MPSMRHTNEVIGAFVACGGRMHLYAYLDKFGECALYCDTDRGSICSEGQRTASETLFEKRSENSHLN